jgi:hypothetical protein
LFDTQLHLTPNSLKRGNFLLSLSVK